MKHCSQEFARSNPRCGRMTGNPSIGAGTFFADAIIGIGACIAAAILLARFGSARTSMSPLIQPEAAREET
jgi:hypothetical protein